MKMKINCLLWTDFTTCTSVFIVEFGQVSAGWEAKGGETKQVKSTKIYFNIFNETVFLFFCFICLLKISNRKATVSKETIGFDV